jgi:hypothetical protein
LGWSDREKERAGLDARAGGLVGFLRIRWRIIGRVLVLGVVVLTSFGRRRTSLAPCEQRQ